MLNIGYTSPDQFTLNDNNYLLFSIVLVHEVLHSLGVVNITGHPSYVDISLINDISYYLWTGTYGISGWVDVINAGNIGLNYSLSDVSYLPLEEDYGSGTVNVHFNEGCDNGQPTLVINNIQYVAIANEIMTGLINLNNYLTPMTTGVLKDLSFGVNSSSSYITVSGLSMEYCDIWPAGTVSNETIWAKWFENGINTSPLTDFSLISVTDFSNWNSSLVTDMSYMFSGAGAVGFEGNGLYKWDISSIPTGSEGLIGFLDDTSLSTSTVDLLLIKWGQDVSSRGGPLDLSLGLLNLSYESTNPSVMSLHHNAGWTYLI